MYPNNSFMKLIITLTLVPTFFLIISTSFLSPSNSYAQNSIMFEEIKPFISILGSAEKEVPSDESKITLAVENTNTNPNEARENNAEKMNAIIEVLKNNGLSEENITTSNFQITPNYDYANENYDTIISYTALNKIELTTSAGTNISKFIDLAVNSGANRVENIDFVISKNTLVNTNKELLKQALNDAREKADILASEGNFTITGIKQIDTSTETVFSPTYRYDTFGATGALEMKSEPSTQIIPKKNTISISFPVVFYITNHPQ